MTNPMERLFLEHVYARFPNQEEYEKALQKNPGLMADWVARLAPEIRKEMFRYILSRQKVEHAGLVRFQPSGEVYIVLGNVLANMREEVAQGVMRNEFEVLAEI